MQVWGESRWFFSWGEGKAKCCPSRDHRSLMCNPKCVTRWDKAPAQAAQAPPCADVSLLCVATEPPAVFDICSFFLFAEQ